MLCPPEFIVMGGGREVSRLWLLFFFLNSSVLLKHAIYVRECGDSNL